MHDTVLVVTTTTTTTTTTASSNNGPNSNATSCSSPFLLLPHWAIDSGGMFIPSFFSHAQLLDLLLLPKSEKLQMVIWPHYNSQVHALTCTPHYSIHDSSIWLLYDIMTPNCMLSLVRYNIMYVCEQPTGLWLPRSIMALAHISPLSGLEIYNWWFTYLLAHDPWAAMLHRHDIIMSYWDLILANSPSRDSGEMGMCSKTGHGHEKSPLFHGSV